MNRRRAYKHPWARLVSWIAVASPIVLAVLVASLALGFVAFLYLVTSWPA